VSGIAIAAAVFAAAIVLALLVFVPRALLRRAQDRLASRLLAESGGTFQLLTRAEMVAGLHRRIPGVLGLTESAISFAGLFGETEVLPTSRIQKIATGRMLASGRKLLRLEVVRFTRPGGDELEFVLAPASAGAWRSHLGLWAVAERKSTMDRVTPGR
jgi:hypothetical protein